MAETAKLAYKVPEFAELSGLGRTRIYGAIKSGELKSIKIGGRRLILAEDGKRFLESHRTSTS